MVTVPESDHDRGDSGDQRRHRTRSGRPGSCPPSEGLETVEMFDVPSGRYWDFGRVHWGSRDRSGSRRRCSPTTVVRDGRCDGGWSGDLLRRPSPSFTPKSDLRTKLGRTGKTNPLDLDFPYLGGNLGHPSF